MGLHFLKSFSPKSGLVRAYLVGFAVSMDPACILFVPRRHVFFHLIATTAKQVDFCCKVRLQIMVYCGLSEISHFIKEYFTKEASLTLDKN